MENIKSNKSNNILFFYQSKIKWYFQHLKQFLVYHAKDKRRLNNFGHFLGLPRQGT